MLNYIPLKCKKVIDMRIEDNGVNAADQETVGMGFSSKLEYAPMLTCGVEHSAEDQVRGNMEIERNRRQLANKKARRTEFYTGSFRFFRPLIHESPFPAI